MLEPLSTDISVASARPSFWQRSGYLQTHLDFLLREINPALARRTLQAKVVDILTETADSRTFVLKLPRRWRGFTAGMYLPVDVSINGALVRRTYSISSPPSQYQRERTVAITVKRVQGGRVSNWLFEHLQIGQWLQVGEAAGTFTVERASSANVLMLAAGSGITPFFSMLNASEHFAQNITLMYYCHYREDAIFAQQLTRLSAIHPQLTLVIIPTDVHGRINSTHLQRHCPDVAQRDVLMCGPEGFMSSATRLLAVEGVRHEQILRESFGFRRDPSVFNTPRYQADVSFVRSTVRIQGDGSKTILELAEQAGLSPKYGCRGGLCHECTCTKVSGQVVDVRTGKKSHLDQEEIQVCISIPQGPVDIAL